MNITPNSTKLLVQQIKTQQKESKAGIALPSTLDREEKTQGKVIAVGSELAKKYKKGQTVFYGKYAGDPLRMVDTKVDFSKEENLVILSDEDVLGWF